MADPDKNILVVGGAYSIDKAIRLQYQAVCREKIWFEQELPTAEEYRRAIKSLADHGNQVDHIITHTGPRSIIPRVIGVSPDAHDLELTGFLDWIYHEISFTHWYFGHLHEGLSINDQIDVCFLTVHPINTDGAACCSATERKITPAKGSAPS